MADYDNSNQGALFKNGRKESAKHPDFTGYIQDITPDIVEAAKAGKRLQLAAWLRSSDSPNVEGGKFYSLKVSLPYDKDKETPADDGFV